MDVDNPPSGNASSFRTDFPSDTKNPYTKSRISQIGTHRSSLHGTLFIDHLLTAVGGFPSPPPYPPRSASSLQRLYTQIHSNPSLDLLRKYCFIFYLLLDYEHAFPTPTGSLPPSESYRQRVLLPDNFVTLMSALWDLDNLRMSSALPKLCDPAVTAPVPEKVITALRELGTAEMVAQFVTSTQPVIKDPTVLEQYFSALLEIDLGQAFLHMRTVPEEAKRKLFKMLIEYAIDVGGQPAMQLVSLPLREEDGEKETFVEVLRGIDNERSRDALAVWWLNVGKYEEALKLMESAEQRASEQIGGLDWAVLGEGLRKGLGPRTNASTTRMEV